MAGGFNEKLTIAFNDVDLCLKIKKLGLRNVWTPHAVLYHHESLSRGYEITLSQQKRFAGEIEFMQKQWGDSLINDPYYNPNYSLENEQAELAFPPRTQKPWQTKEKS